MASSAPAEEPAPKDPVASIAGQITLLSTGDRAALRRIYLTQASGSRARAADGIVLGLLHHAGVDLAMHPETFANWKLLAHVAAVLSGTGGKNPHAPRKRLGAALAAAGYSENRFLRLTAAQGEPLRNQIRLAARFIAQDGQDAIDLWAIRLLLAHDDKRADEARIRIAQDYYAAAARA